MTHTYINSLYSQELLWSKNRFLDLGKVVLSMPVVPCQAVVNLKGNFAGILIFVNKD